MRKPETTAIAAFMVDRQGDIVANGKEIFYNADTPLVAASTMKLLVLAAYESAVARGELDPNQRVAIKDLERYYLPKTDCISIIQTGVQSKSNS